MVTCFCTCSTRHTSGFLNRMLAAHSAQSVRMVAQAIRTELSAMPTLPRVRRSISDRLHE